MNTEKLKQEILAGKLFIYPTDTIYGIGCDATNEQAVEKIKQIKHRDKDKPLSIIAPNKEWIKQNMIVDADLDKYLPGPYTLILKKKNPNFLNHISPTDSLGIRIPSNPLTKDIQQALVPFVTTSINLSGEPFVTKVSEIKPEITEKIDHTIDIGELNGNPSTLIIDGKEIQR